MFTVHGERSLESGVGKFQSSAIFSGILRFEAMPVSSQQHRAAIGRFVSMMMHLMAERAKKAAAVVRTLTVPLTIRASDVLVLFLIGLLAQVW